MISFDDAVATIRAVARPLGIETVAIDQAAARVLAAPCLARINSPRTDVSAMDGYAILESDLSALPARLRVVGESFAGTGWSGRLETGDCARIFTGAPVPAGGERVVIQEDVARDGEWAIIANHPGPARHIRRRGSDFSEGDTLLPVGRLLDKGALVAAAGADLAAVKVFTRPTVHILSTGDELTEPGSAATRPDVLPESVSLGIAELVREWGGDVTGRSRLRDDLDDMRTVAERVVTAADLIVVTGGASVGERDFAKAMFEPLGLELLFSKVAMKPGKPVWLGRIRKTLVIGVPGNPTSALVTARLFLAPLLAGLSGRNPNEALAWRCAKLGVALGQCGSRETFHRARWVGKAVEILKFQDSSAQKALAEAEVLLRQLANSPPVPSNAEVTVLDF